MKWVFGLLIIGGAVLGIAYYASGVAGLDPTKQGREARAKMVPGTAWQQIEKSVGKPLEYRVIMRVKRTIGGDPVETLEPGPDMRYDAAMFAAEFKNNSFPDGFLWRYHYSDQVSFSVEFDAKGLLVGTQDEATAADLLGTRER